MEKSRLGQEIDGVMRVMRTIERNHPEVNAGQSLGISGSASMVMHGIDRGKTIGDIDIFATTEAWFHLFESGEWLAYTPDDSDQRRRFDPPFLYSKFPFNVERTADQRGVDTIEVNVFAAWRERPWGNISVADLFANTKAISMIRCVEMEWLKNWKEEVQRSKDLPDIDLINDYLKESH